MKWYQKLAAGAAVLPFLLGSPAKAQVESRPDEAVVFQIDTSDGFSAYATDAGLPDTLARLLASYTDSKGRPIFDHEAVSIIKDGLSAGEDIESMLTSLPHGFVRSIADIRHEGEKVFGWSDILTYNGTDCAISWTGGKVGYAKSLADAGFTGEEIVDACRADLEPLAASRWKRFLSQHQRPSVASIADLFHWQVSENLAEVMLEAEPERDGNCTIEDVIEFRKTGGSAGYFRWMPTIFTCEERIRAFERLMPIQYAEMFQSIREETGDPAINGLSVLEFWMADRPDTVWVPLNGTRKSVDIYDLEDIVEEDPLGFQNVVPRHPLMASLTSSVRGLLEKEEEITAYIRTATGREHGIGWTLDAVQAYRFFQLGIPSEDILPDREDIGQEPLSLLVYSETDRNGAFFPDESPLSYHILKERGWRPVVTIVGSVDEYCEALQYFSGAELVSKKGHGTRRTHEVGRAWTGDGTKKYITTDTDMGDCYSSTAPQATIVLEACSNGALPGSPEEYTVPVNLVNHCALNAPGRNCIGATELIAGRTVDVVSWMPLEVRMYACERQGDSEKCKPTQRNVTATSYSVSDPISASAPRAPARGLSHQ